MSTDGFRKIGIVERALCWWWSVRHLGFWWAAPKWLWWASYRPKRCVFCGAWFFAGWWQDICTKECSDEELEELKQLHSEPLR